jgi:hypothetical protein
MANGKKSFVLYCDLIHTIDKMPHDKAGELFKHILHYVNDLNPTTSDLVIELTFEPIKQQLKRDLERWENQIKPLRQNAGRLGGLAKASKRVANEANEKQNLANLAVNVNVNVNDSVNTLTKVNDIYGEVFTNYVSLWLDYKKTRKESYKSEKSIMMFCDKLSKLSKGQISNTKEIIETSMANNWAGIFELKNNPTEPTSKIERQINQAERVLHELTNNI